MKNAYIRAWAISSPAQFRRSTRPADGQYSRLKLSPQGHSNEGSRCPAETHRRFPVKVVADMLSVARSNLIERMQGATRPRGPYRRQGDDELLQAIRQLTDARPTYGYRRITALLNRARRASGAEPVNHKRVFRLMRQAHLLLQPHTGLRPMRAHEGSVIALASNQRWSSDVLEIGCWNGEVVRVAFAIDTCDREIIAWHATTGGISGEMVRDLMLACVERRFAAIRAPYPVQWLADNGSAYTAAETLVFAAALASLPASPQCAVPKATALARPSSKPSNVTMPGSRPDPTLQPCCSWFPNGSRTTTNTIHTAACACAHPVSSFNANRNLPRVRFNGGNSSTACARR